MILLLCSFFCCSLCLGCLLTGCWTGLVAALACICCYCLAFWDSLLSFASGHFGALFELFFACLRVSEGSSSLFGLGFPFYLCGSHVVGLAPNTVFTTFLCGGLISSTLLLDLDTWLSFSCRWMFNSSSFCRVSPLLEFGACICMPVALNCPFLLL